jgi:hypothetical protein
MFDAGMGLFLWISDPKNVDVTKSKARIIKNIENMISIILIFMALRKY